MAAPYPFSQNISNQCQNFPGHGPGPALNDYGPVHGSFNCGPPCDFGPGPAPFNYWPGPAGHGSGPCDFGPGPGPNDFGPDPNYFGPCPDPNDFGRGPPSSFGPPSNCGPGLPPCDLGPGPVPNTFGSPPAAVCDFGPGPGPFDRLPATGPYDCAPGPAHNFGPGPAPCDFGPCPPPCSFGPGPALCDYGPGPAGFESGSVSYQPGGPGHCGPGPALIDYGHGPVACDYGPGPVPFNYCGPADGVSGNFEGIGPSPFPSGPFQCAPNEFIAPDSFGPPQPSSFNQPSGFQQEPLMQEGPFYASAKRFRARSKRPSGRVGYQRFGAKAGRQLYICNFCNIRAYSKADWAVHVNGIKHIAEVLDSKAEVLVLERKTKDTPIAKVAAASSKMDSNLDTNIGERNNLVKVEAPRSTAKSVEVTARSTNAQTSKVCSGSGQSLEKTVERAKFQSDRQTNFGDIKAASSAEIVPKKAPTYAAPAFCQLCGVRAYSEGNWLAHISGKKHKANVAEQNLLDAAMEGCSSAKSSGEAKSAIANESKPSNGGGQSFEQMLESLNLPNDGSIVQLPSSKDSPEQYQCKLCDVICPSLKKLKGHLRSPFHTSNMNKRNKSSHSIDGDSFTCELCHVTCRNSTVFWRHLIGNITCAFHSLPSDNPTPVFKVVGFTRKSTHMLYTRRPKRKRQARNSKTREESLPEATKDNINKMPQFSSDEVMQEMLAAIFDGDTTSEFELESKELGEVFNAMFNAHATPKSESPEETEAKSALYSLKTE